MIEVRFPAIAAAIRGTLESQGFTKLIGAEVVAVEPRVVVMAVDRRPEVLQQAGLFHGGGVPPPIDKFAPAPPPAPIDPTHPTGLTPQNKINLGAPTTRAPLSRRATPI